MITPFTWLVWCLILVSFIVVIPPVLFLFHDEEPTQPITHTNTHKTLIKFLLEIFWDMFAWSTSSFKTKRSYSGKKISSKIFFISAYSFIMITTWAYRFVLKLLLWFQLRFKQGVHKSRTYHSFQVCGNRFSSGYCQQWPRMGGKRSSVAQLVHRIWGKYINLTIFHVTYSKCIAIICGVLFHNAHWHIRSVL